MPQRAVIERITEVQRVGKNNALEQQIEVVFNVGDDGPFRVFTPASEFSEAKILPLVEKRAAEIAKVRAAFLEK